MDVVNSLGRAYENGKRLDDGLILRIVELSKTGTAAQEVCQVLGVKSHTQRRVIAIYGRCTTAADVRATHPKRGGARGACTQIGHEEREFLLDACAMAPTLENRDYRDLLFICFGVEVTEQHVGSVLTKELRLTYKRLSILRPERLTPTNLLKTQDYFGYLANFNPRQLRYFDECAVGSKGLEPRYGRSPQGQRASIEQANASWGRWSVNALTCIREEEPACYWSAVRRSTLADDLLDFFRGAIDETLQPGDVVVLDNCRTHHQFAGELKRMLNAAGVALLFLPPYSPFLNPIELHFNTLKGAIRRNYSTADRWTAFESLFCAMDDTATTANMASYYGKCVFG
jgi:transposase